MSIKRELEEAGVCFEEKRPYLMVDENKVFLRFVDEDNRLEYRLHGKMACSVSMSGFSLSVQHLDFDIPAPRYLASCFVTSVKMQYRNAHRSKLNNDDF